MRRGGPKRDHSYYMHLAYKEAEKAAEKNEVPVGAVIVSDNTIISRSHNLREIKKDPLAHAEVIAIKKACKKLDSWRLDKCTLYVTLEPCAMCAAVLWQARIGAVYYGATDPKGGVVSLNISIHNNLKLNHRYDMHHLHTPECGAVLTAFFKAKRKKK